MENNNNDEIEKLKLELQEARLLAEELKAKLEEVQIQADELYWQVQLIYKVKIEDDENIIRHLRTKMGQITSWEQKYNVLANSKLGRFTLAYWEKREKLKAKLKGR